MLLFDCFFSWGLLSDDGDEEEFRATFGSGLAPDVAEDASVLRTSSWHRTTAIKVSRLTTLSLAKLSISNVREMPTIKKVQLVQWVQLVNAQIALASIPNGPFF